MRRSLVGPVAGRCTACLRDRGGTRPGRTAGDLQRRLGYAHVSPTASPPGANDWSCKPSAAHPRPVVLVHGTFADMSDSWQALSPLLKNNGYCVFALNYGSYAGSGAIGVYGVGDIAASADRTRRLRRQSPRRDRRRRGRHGRPLAGRDDAALLPEVPRRRGQGPHPRRPLALQPRHHPRRALHPRRLLPRREPVHRRPLPGLRSSRRAGSAFLTELNSGGDTVPGVEYTVIQTRYDQVVTPYTSAFLSGSNVNNVLLQNQCILDLGDHLSMPYDHIADADVLTALDPLHPRAPALHADRADRRAADGSQPRVRSPRGRAPASAAACRRGRRGAGSSAGPSPAAGRNGPLL